MRRVQRFKLDPMEYSDFIRSLVGSKQPAYTRALVKLETLGLLSRHTVVALFIKKEKAKLKGNLSAGCYPTTNAQCYYSLPRLIRPMSVEYNLAVGVYIKAIEGVVYKDIGVMMGGASVTKGMDAFKVAEVAFDKFERLRRTHGETAILICDITKFELCVGIECHKALIDYCCRMLSTSQHSKRLKWLLEKQLKVKFVSRCVDGVIKFTCLGTLCSGVMNTSLWAVLLMTIAITSVGDDLGLVPGIDYDYICAGDDTNPMVPIKFLKRWKKKMPEVLLDLGFVLTIDNIVTEFEKMDFCQCRPVFDGSRWRMVRNPDTARRKDVLFIHPVNNSKDWDKARGSIADCGLALCCGIPVMQAFYQHLGQGLNLSAVKRAEDSGMGRLAHGLRAAVVPITVDARLSYWKAFGVTPHAQHIKELLYAQTPLIWKLPTEVTPIISNHNIF